MSESQKAAAAMKSQLEKSTLPRHDIICFADRIMVECGSRDTCAKWAQLLGTFATVQGMIKSLAYVGDSVNSGSPRTFTIWRVYAKVV